MRPPAAGNRRIEAGGERKPNYYRYILISLISRVSLAVIILLRIEVLICDWNLAESKFISVQIV